MTATSIGKVYLVGAGPGDRELITLKGKRCLETADVVFYDELVNRELLDFVSANAEIVYVGKIPDRCAGDQRAIEAMLIGRAREGKQVVRLKGGDPFVFGRGGEEAQALSAAGIPVTHRSYAFSVAFVTGHKAAGGEVKWGELARATDTLIILMGLQNIRAIMGRLLAEGCEPDRPVALIESGRLPLQRTAVGTVATIAAMALQR